MLHLIMKIQVNTTTSIYKNNANIIPSLIKNKFKF